jgi:haloalkane dehalogenase
MKLNFSSIVVFSFLFGFFATSCEKDDDITIEDPPEATIDTLMTADGIEFVRTPESNFDNLPDWPYAYQYVEIDGLRQAYAEAGPADGEVVLLLHGQPSWSYLYRKMIPELADAGYRVIAMDHLGFGRSDKPVDISSYSYLGHYDRIERFIEQLNLSDINLFGQDWGAVIGLRVVGMNPDWFKSVVIGNGFLPNVPAGETIYPPVEDPETIVDIPSIFTQYTPQQVPYYDNCERLIEEFDFAEWMIYTMKARAFKASEVLEGWTWFDLPTEVEVAYDAPFPSREYMAGARVFPSLLNETPGVTQQAWFGLASFQKPFLTIWGGNDALDLGDCPLQQAFIDNIPGASGKPHYRFPDASHYLQDDQGEEIARKMIDFYNGDYDGGNF